MKSPTNFLTQEQARKRACPFARATRIVHRDDEFHTEVGVTSVNRVMNDGGPTHDTLCLASVCMAWRWHPDGKRGYCGAAGNPFSGA